MHRNKYVKWLCHFPVILLCALPLAKYSECRASHHAAIVSEDVDGVESKSIFGDYQLSSDDYKNSMAENVLTHHKYQDRHPAVSAYDLSSSDGENIDYWYDPRAKGLDKMRKEHLKARVKSLKDNYAFLEKGVYYISLSANFTNIDATKLVLEPIFEIHGIQTNNFDLEFSYGQFVKDNLAFGFAVAYKFSDVRADVSSDILQLLINARRYETNNLSSGYRVGGYMRNYFPIEYTHRLYLVNEMQIMFSHSEGLQRNVYDQGVMLSKVRSRTFTGGLRMSLGVMYFLSQGLAIDFNISPVAAMYQYNSVINNEKINGKFAGGGINTIIMPIDLKFGLSYYFGLDYGKRNKWLREVSEGPLNIYR